jgi:hypothetical protein
MVNASDVHVGNMDIIQIQGPNNNTSDRGTQFSSELWAVLYRRLGAQHTTTNAYHPQLSGAVERVHWLKDSLRACLASNKWPEHLSWL